MQKKVIIFLYSHKNIEPSLDHLQADWIITHNNGLIQEKVIAGNLAQIKVEDDAEIIAIIPPQDVLITHASLPQLSHHRLQQTLPYALEEHLLDEVDQLHFACGPYQDNHKLPVTVVKKDLMECWLKLFHARDIRPDTVIPATLAIPYIENQWHIVVLDDHAIVRTGLYTGFSSDIQNLETLLSLKIAEKEEILPEKIIVYHPCDYSVSFSSLSIPLEKREFSNQQFIELIASALGENTYINLLQQSYASTRSFKAHKQNIKIWKIVAITFSIWLGLLFLSKIGSLALLEYQHHHLQNAIQRIYYHHFPLATAVMDPSSHLEGKLKKIMTQNNRHRFLLWLGYLAKVSSSIQIQSLNFQHNQLILDVTSSSYESLDKFILSLKKEGISVQQQSTAILGNQIKAVLIIHVLITQGGTV